MESEGEREIEGEVKKEWMESVEKWKEVEGKRGDVVKKIERMEEMNVYMTVSVDLRDAFEVNGSIIRCYEGWHTWMVDREVRSVWLEGG